MFECMLCGFELKDNRRQRYCRVDQSRIDSKHKARRNDESNNKHLNIADLDQGKCKTSILIIYK